MQSQRGLRLTIPQGTALTAGRLVLDKRSKCLANGVDFAVERTLAGAGILSLMKQAEARGFEIRLIFVALKNAELSIQRVRERSALGGHFVPSDDVRRRYTRGLPNAPAAIRYSGFRRALRQLAIRSLKDHGSPARRRSLDGAAASRTVRRVLSDLESAKAQQA
jgi:hypothetical protein